ncbi:hypothetical protein IQ279_23930 [Streptomyces verrucosisporus]|uniref:lantibiotic dehydratase C-terminal domain-containing protein n=1 Tax=Streptomyces verrucosisporus TaxID=1695161 RepID=UPI0019D30C7D|nr:lantibiotic dehydratase C-terminal domain-containing protein [Streptomyces verrucosisporus]MBN3932627.1 hypothetical protein [Streptomyces verrucosisporus]
MSRTEAAAWQSLHIHRYEDQDGFLVNGLAPVLTPLRASGAVEDFFFLRYWQGGHHIRLRLRTSLKTAQDVADALVAHLARHPAAAGLDAEEFGPAQATMAVLEAETASEVLPSDSVHHATYTPESEKYGGDLGVAIAERFFAASSDVALATLARLPGGSGKRLGVAFSTMLRGLCAARLTPAEMAGFFAHYCVLWSPYVFDRFLATWPELLRARRESVGRHAATVLDQSDQEPTGLFGRAVGTAWRELAESADTVLPAVTLGGNDAPVARRRQILLVSYLHTHNNRLGLIPEQESFLGWLGHHVISEYAGLPPAADLLDRVRATRRERLGAYAGLAPTA